MNSVFLIGSPSLVQIARSKHVEERLKYENQVHAVRWSSFGDGLLGWSKVARSSSDPQSSAVAVHSDLYFSKHTVAIGVAGVISNSVLVANASGNVAPDSL